MPQITQMVGSRPWDTGIRAGIIVMTSSVILVHVITGLMVGVCGGKFQAHLSPIHKNGNEEMSKNNLPVHRTLTKNGGYHPRYGQRKEMSPNELGNDFDFLVKANQFVHKIVPVYSSVYHKTGLERNERS